MADRSWWISWRIIAGVAVAIVALVGGVMVLSQSGSQSGSPDDEPGASGFEPDQDRATSAPADARPEPRVTAGMHQGGPPAVAPRVQASRPDLPLALVASSYELAAPDLLSIRYTTGVPECYGSLDRTAVQEHADRVVVTLLVRPPASPPSGPCPDIALVEETEVRLEAPLGGREVIDAGTRQVLPRGHETS